MAILGLVISTFLLAIPLSAFLWNLAQQSPSGLAGQVKELVQSHGYEMKHLERGNEYIEIHVQGPKQPPKEVLDHLAGTVRESLGEGVKIRVVTQLAVELE